MYLHVTATATEEERLSAQWQHIKFKFRDKYQWNSGHGTNLFLSVSKDDTSFNKNSPAVMRFWLAVTSYQHLKIANGFITFSIKVHLVEAQS